jgi:hypothetical protein
MQTASIRFQVDRKAYQASTQLPSPSALGDLKVGAVAAVHESAELQPESHLAPFGTHLAAHPLLLAPAQTSAASARPVSTSSEWSRPPDCANGPPAAPAAAPALLSFSPGHQTAGGREKSSPLREVVRGTHAAPDWCGFACQRSLEPNSVRASALGDRAPISAR